METRIQVPVSCSHGCETPTYELPAAPGAVERVDAIRKANEGGPHGHTVRTLAVAYHRGGAFADYWPIQVGPRPISD